MLVKEGSSHLYTEGTVIDGDFSGRVKVRMDCSYATGEESTKEMEAAESQGHTLRPLAQTLPPLSISMRKHLEEYKTSTDDQAETKGSDEPKGAVKSYLPQELRNLTTDDPTKSLMQKWAASSGELKLMWLRAIEAVVVKTKWWGLYMGQMKGGVMSAAQQSGVRKVYLVAIEGGPISQVETMHLKLRMKEIQKDLVQMKVKARVEVLQFRRFAEFENMVISHNDLEGNKAEGSMVVGIPKKQRSMTPVATSPKKGKLAPVSTLPTMPLPEGSFQNQNQQEGEGKDQHSASKTLVPVQAMAAKKENVTFVGGGGSYNTEMLPQQHLAQSAGAAATPFPTLRVPIRAGDRVTIVKKGHHLGETAMVIQANWMDRVKVQMDEGHHDTKSYLPIQLKLRRPAIRRSLTCAPTVDTVPQPETVDEATLFYADTRQDRDPRGNDALAVAPGGKSNDSMTNLWLYGPYPALRTHQKGREPDVRKHHNRSLMHALF
jgi:hypothetical protein